MRRVPALSDVLPMTVLSTEWQECTPQQMDLLTRTMIEIMRRSSGHEPAPRGMPFFGLDHPAGEFSPYESLAAHGIFRKYESVLVLGAGLGGAARWCHVHFGCDVTGVDAVHLAAAAAQLSARARLSSHTRFLTAAAAALPLRPAGFTHVWVIDALADVVPEDRRLREVARAVRLGGLVALQQTGVAAEWAAKASEAMRRAGLVEVRERLVERPPLRETLRRARERLLAALRQADDPLAPDTAAAVERVYGHFPLEGGGVTQIFARRAS